MRIAFGDRLIEIECFYGSIDRMACDILEKLNERNQLYEKRK
jgi:hypothetical protein